MLKRYCYITFIAVCTFVSSVTAQTRVEIYADIQGNDSLQQFVNILVTQLKKSQPGDYPIRSVLSYQGKGIYIGSLTAAQPVKPPAALLKADVESFSINGTDKTMQLHGQSNMALGHAIFHYLDLIGFRFYFANPDWHIIPVSPVLFKKINLISSPSFVHRRIWYGYGTGSKIADADYNFWVLANKIGGSMNASYGHAYEDIASRNRPLFSNHPEWYYPTAKRGEIPDAAKFDMSKEDLVQAVIQVVENRIETSLKEKNNDYKMISLAPSDGTGTCNTPACQKLGSFSDRVFYLVNRVAKAIQKKYPSTYIGCLAYSEYIAPPSIKIEPNVFVGITTAFNTSKFSTEQLVDEWRKKGATTGIYDYFSWYLWDYDIPGQSTASNYKLALASLKKFYDKGVKAYEGESSIGWVSKGLGYYLIAKKMWDINFDEQAARNEFFQLTFQKAASLMDKLWNEWENNVFTNVREGDLARWIDYVTEAQRIEQNPAVKKRFFQVKSYLYFLGLYKDYFTKKSESNLIKLLNFGYRKLDDGSVAGFPAIWEVGARSGYSGMGFTDDAKYKSNKTAVTDAELDRALSSYRSTLKSHAPVKTFSPPLQFTNVPNLSRYQSVIADSAINDNAWWYTNEWVIQVKNKGESNFIDFTGDYLADATNSRPIKISVYPYTPDGNVAGKAALVYYEYTKVKVKERISLAKLPIGFYTVLIEDPVKIFRFKFSPDINFSQVVRRDRPIRSQSLNYCFIYVPEGVEKFNVMKTKLIQFITPTGRTLSFMNNQSEDLQIDVQKGEAGLWRVKSLYDDVFFEGIPPVISTSATQMLIPTGIK